MRSDIDALARILDGDPTVNGEATAETRALAALATAMASAAKPVRAEFKADLRASLIEAARAQAASPPLLTRIRTGVNDATARWRYSTRVATATGVATLALSSGGVATAAQQAMPGDVLYGVRLTLEDARVALIRDPVARGAAELRYARHRLEEARIATAAGNHAAAADALAEADESARDGAALLIEAAENDHPDALDVLDEFTNGQRLRLQQLLPTLTGEAARMAEDVISSLHGIHGSVERRRPDAPTADEPRSPVGGGAEPRKGQDSRAEQRADDRAAPHSGSGSADGSDETTDDRETLPQTGDDRAVEDGSGVDDAVTNPPLEPGASTGGVLPTEPAVDPPTGAGALP